MALDLAQQRQQAHSLLDGLPDEKLLVVRSLLEVLAEPDPVARALANAPYDDEPVSEEEARDIAAARATLARSETIPHEEVLAEFGLTGEDFERMAQTPIQTPLEPRSAGR